MQTCLVSEHPVEVNVLTLPAHCRILRKETLILCFAHFDLDRAGRRHF